MLQEEGPLLPGRLAAAIAFALAALVLPARAGAQPSARDAPAAIDLPALAPRVSGGQGAGHWRGGILFDESFRSAIRLGAVEDQEIARTISDITLGAVVLQAALLDAALVPAIRGDGDLVWRAEFAHALALGITISGGEIVKRLVGRARPYERDCDADPSRHGCDASDLFHSFYSLHSGVAFTSAGFSCAMHLDRGLYSDLGADASACGVSLALAASTGILRVVADRHYLSDVLVGAALGFLVGYLMPLALVPEIEPRQPPAQVSPQQLTSAPIGVSFGGTF